MSDSCIRIWFWEHKLLDSGGYYKVNLFEYGILPEVTNSRSENRSTGHHYALYSSFEITGRGDNEAWWLVNCVKINLLNPVNGWDNFAKKIIENSIDTIYKLPEGQSGSPNCSACHTSLEYILGDSIIKIDYTAKHDIYHSKFPRDLSFVALMDLVNKEFNLAITTN